MTASRDDTEADAGAEADAESGTETDATVGAEADTETNAESPFRRAYRRLVDGVNWFREFNRGYSNNSHFLDRKD